MNYGSSAKSRVMATMMIYFSTFTGDPMRTTLGNTLRSKAYIEFVRHRAMIKRKDMSTGNAGDD